ncbi:MAG: hypothetical protein IJM03_02030 [Treponema sp.]|nr:hypothetical protein [Treponema sp.]
MENSFCKLAIRLSFFEQPAIDSQNGIFVYAKGRIFAECENTALFSTKYVLLCLKPSNLAGIGGAVG